MYIDRGAEAHNNIKEKNWKGKRKKTRDYREINRKKAISGNRYEQKEIEKQKQGKKGNKKKYRKYGRKGENFRQR